VDYLYPLLATLAAYLIGSLSFAVIVSKAFGLADPRTYGSKNPGATNVLRSGSKAAAILTLALDALKGYVPVMLVKLFGAQYGLMGGTLALVAFAAFMGHVYPVFFKFKGGKGVATAAGVVFGIDWLLGLATLASFGIIVYFFRWVSLASMAAAAFVPFFYLLGDRGPWYTSKAVLAALFFIALVLVVRHKDNINRLLQGTEPQLGKKSIK
jgi:acyl phosphate:glycerol-3-phosphate acyltransferase